MFYENFNSVVTLDNQLNENQNINFSENEIPIKASAAGISGKNSLRIFNNLNNKIGLFDYLKKEYKLISNPISNKLKFYQPDFNNFYFIDENNNLFDYDIYDKVFFIHKIPNFDSISIIINSQIIYSQSNLLFLLELDKKATNKIEINKHQTIESFCKKSRF